MEADVSQGRCSCSSSHCRPAKHHDAHLLNPHNAASSLNPVALSVATVQGPGGHWQWKATSRKGRRPSNSHCLFSLNIVGLCYCTVIARQGSGGHWQWKPTSRKGRNSIHGYSLLQAKCEQFLSAVTVIYCRAGAWRPLAVEADIAQGSQRSSSHRRPAKHHDAHRRHGTAGRSRIS